VKPILTCSGKARALTDRNKTKQNTSKSTEGEGVGTRTHNKLKFLENVN
jgi:hypothetical protein